MKIVLLLALLTVSECGSSSVVGQTGQSVTLPCTYNFKHYGALSVCWGRGDLPRSGCNNQLISTDGRRVREGTRASSRYQLLGRLDEGDVSLTILSLTDSDAGRYGCKVEIPGWFNDDKHHFDLTIETVSTLSDQYSPPPAISAAAASSPTPSTEAVQCTPSGHMNFTETLLTSSSSSISAEVDSLQSFIGNTVRVSFTVFIPALLLTAAYRFWRTNQRPETDRRLNQSEEEEVYSSV